jgi:hypothetical protein
MENSTGGGVSSPFPAYPPGGIGNGIILQGLPRATHRPPTPSFLQRPAPTEKAGVICFVVGVRRESEARNEEPMREVAPFGTSDRAPYPKCGLS